MTKTTDTPMVYDVNDATGEIVYRPMNAEELAQAKIDAKSAVEEIRQDKQRAIERALAATDWYALREAEGGTKTPAKVKTYRADLRALHATLETAKKPEAIEIPESP